MMITKAVESWIRDVNTNTIKWNAVPLTTDTSFLLPNGNYTVDSGVPLLPMYPIEPSDGYRFTHHNCAHLGAQHLHVLVNCVPVFTAPVEII